MLRKKQVITSNEEWLECRASSTIECTKDHIENITERTIERIDRILRGKSACSGWCAGKDSIVLDDLMRKWGGQYTPIIWKGINNYPAMDRWIGDNRPRGLIESVIDKFSLAFIEKNPEYLFCLGDTRQKWMSAKWSKQRKDTEKFDLFVTGRRLLDGNVCGNVSNDFVRNKTFSPIADWTHEELFSYIEYNGIALPPFYEWSRGFLLGSVAMGEWTERPANELSEDEVWDEIYEIDESIVHNAAQDLRRANDYLERKHS